jgi:hypothetical protein
LAQAAESLRKYGEGAFADNEKSPNFPIHISPPSWRVPFASHDFRKSRPIISPSVIF